MFDLDEVGAGGEEGDVGEFRRQREAELEEAERDREITVEVLGNLAADLAEDTGVEAVVATRDDEDVARGRRVGSDGSVLSGSEFAMGSGAQVALGVFESADRGRDLPSTEVFLRDVLETVAERDTGEEVDLWSFANG